MAFNTQRLQVTGHSGATLAPPPRPTKEALARLCIVCPLQRSLARGERTVISDISNRLNHRRHSRETRHEKTSPFASDVALELLTANCRV